MERANRSVTEALSRAHAALREDLGHLDEAVRPLSRENAAGLRARLASTQVQIAEHFRFEEQNGYMDTVRQREPRLERTVQKLAEEHRQITRTLETLLAETRLADSLDEPYRRRVRQWVEHVRQHEAREDHLVHDAFNLDYALED